jgi:hypothetical protein
VIQTDSIVVWLIVCLLLAVEHWFEWPKRLHRLVAYIIGTLTLNVPLTLWIVLMRPPIGAIVATMWGSTVFGGATVLVAWGYDAMMLNYRRRRVSERDSRRMLTELESDGTE